MQTLTVLFAKGSVVISLREQLFRLKPLSLGSMLLFRYQRSPSLT